MSVVQFFCYLAVMAIVTYLIRAIPFVLCKNEITNQFFRSFLAYIPYAVLGAMTFPAVFYSTNGIIAGIAGTIIALILALRQKGLLTVAVGASILAFGIKIIQYYFI